MEKANLYDFFKFQPAAYNMSINQADEDKKNTRIAKDISMHGKDPIKDEKELPELKQEIKMVMELPKKANPMDAIGGGKNMSEALAQIKESNKAEPVFTRGAEQEIVTMQEVENWKSYLAHIKIHIPF